MRPWRGITAGMAAGAAGTCALNGATYLDMAVRGRPASSTPEKTVETLAGKAGISIPGDDDTRTNRLSALGSLNGMLVGVGVGASLGLARAAGFRPSVVVAGVVTGAAAMASTDSSMAALGVSDPRTWGPTAWLSDALPHLAFGLVTAAVLYAMDGDA